MKNGQDDNTKEFLNKALRQVLVEVDDNISMPLLNRKTEQIVINCHGGSVVDWKPLLKFK